MTTMLRCQYQEYQKTIPKHKKYKQMMTRTCNVKINTDKNLFHPYF